MKSTHPVVCQPQGTSEKCKCNCDNGWKKLKEIGLPPVRQVAIDEDWSTLHFRRMEFIKTLMRC